jgi:hypothetical protein
MFRTWGRFFHAWEVVMAFKSKTPAWDKAGKGMARSKPLQTKAPLKAKTTLKAQKTLKEKPSFTTHSSFATKPASPLDAIKAQKVALQKATIRALEKARREALDAGVDLSEWESEFIEGVSERVKTYGRAFADPDKGAMNGTLSLRQGLKLKEIRKKVQTKRGTKPETET